MNNTDFQTSLLEATTSQDVLKALTRYLATRVTWAEICLLREGRLELQTYLHTDMAKEARHPL